MLRSRFVFPLLAALLAACSHGDPAPRLAAARVSTLAINNYIWRAALETIKFMPLAQADASSGTILTDWYSHPQVPNERVKLTVLVLDRELRADALSVGATRQELRQGVWVTVPLRADTVQKLEEAILQRARQLRQSAIADRG